MEEMMKHLEIEIFSPLKIFLSPFLLCMTNFPMSVLVLPLPYLPGQEDHYVVDSG